MNLEALSSEELAEIASQNGRRRKIVGMLYERHSGEVYAFVKRRTGDEELSKDISQITFCKLLENIDSYDPNKKRGIFRTWLLRIAANSIVDHYKKRRLPRDEFDLGEQVADSRLDPLQFVEYKELAQAVQEGIDALPKKQREVFELRMKYTMPYEDISSQLGIPRGSTKSHMHAARQRIKKRLHKNGQLLTSL